MGERELMCVFYHTDPLLALYVVPFKFLFLFSRVLADFWVVSLVFGCLKILFFSISVLRLGIFAEEFTDVA